MLAILYLKSSNAAMHVIPSSNDFSHSKKISAKTNISEKMPFQQRKLIGYNDNPLLFVFRCPWWAAIGNFQDAKFAANWQYIPRIHHLIYIYIYIYIWSPPPPGPTFSHPRRGRRHRDIYNKIVHSTETMEKTVKNEHLSKWKLICTESKNCCKSVLFRPKFGLESHGLKYIWYPPKKNLPLCMFYWYLHLWFDYVKKYKKPRENQNKKQYSRTLAKAKIQKTSRKPKKNKKIKKTNIPGLLQK